MAEKVRLIIWDLDDTFWQGTLSEGEIAFIESNKDLVIDLCHKGVMSSICSKNHFEPVREVLAKNGVWDYFIMPSINWEPKGARVRKIIDDAQLRPETVLFIDDNHINLAEVRHSCPGIQVADEKVLKDIWQKFEFNVKDDATLSRLAQYKVLEAKQSDAIRFGNNSNLDFLRQSEIRVSITTIDKKDYGRVVELINRTNQLNFTKLRLPENVDEAINDVAKLLSNKRFEMAIVSVADKYGAYGLVGMYCLDLKNNILTHFCFSCRTLNMGIEQWVYNRLGCPNIKIVGEVVSELNKPASVDWIKEVASINETNITHSGNRPLDRLVMRGGCEQRALTHYLKPLANESFGEHNFPRHDIAFRVEHSMMARLLLNGITSHQRDILYKLGYENEDLVSRLFEPFDGEGLAILSFWTDARMGCIQHQPTGMVLPYAPLARHRAQEGTFAYSAATLIEAEFKRWGFTPENIYKETIVQSFASIPSHFRKAFILANTHYQDVTSSTIEIPRAAQYNCWALEALAQHPSVEVFDIRECIESEDEVKTGGTHFARTVHHRLSDAIISRFRLGV